MGAQTDPYAPQRRYSSKQAEKGLVKVTVWVPADDRERALNYAEKLRIEHEQAQIS